MIGCSKILFDWPIAPSSRHQFENHSRQFLRLIAVTSVRNSLETRYSSCEIESECQKPISKLLQTMCNINSAVIDLHLLLQDQDVNRLRQTVYRDLDDQKNSEFLALASVYLGPFSKKIRAF